MVPDKQFWNDRYIQQQTGWDMGQISTPLKNYIDQISDKNISVLIPGCGNAHEAEYLLKQGFIDVTLIDIADEVVKEIEKKFSNEIAKGSLKVICGDFFELNHSFDLVIEQTFFCAINPTLRQKYADKMFEILKPNGKLAGVMFGVKMEGGPPFGGTKEEYEKYFSPYFHFNKMEDCYNSIKPREGRELFVILQKKSV